MRVLLCIDFITYVATLKEGTVATSYSASYEALTKKKFVVAQKRNKACLILYTGFEKEELCCSKVEKAKFCRKISFNIIRVISLLYD